MQLIEKGELSHAARELKTQGLAPGNATTLTELVNLDLRPQHLSEPIAPAALNFQPQPLTLDKDIFATVLRQIAGQHLHVTPRYPNMDCIENLSLQPSRHKALQ